MTRQADIPVEAILRDELAHGDVVLDTIGPIMGHLLANSDHSLFSDEIVARVRSMIGHVAQQLLLAHGEAAQMADPIGFATEHAGPLCESLCSHLPLLIHCHSLAQEWQLADRLERRHSIDLVLSPLLQALISSEDSSTAGTAMAALAAQARFIQQARRMELHIDELPGDLFHHTLTALRNYADTESQEAAKRTEAQLRKNYDEGQSRLALMNRLIMGLGQGVRAALNLGHAGVSLFVTALAIASHQDRGLAVISTNECQLARLALGLRSAGLKPKEVAEVFLYIHPEVSLPEGFDGMRVEQAAAILESSAGWRSE
jgi:hypothetical protein